MFCVTFFRQYQFTLFCFTLGVIFFYILDSIFKIFWKIFGLDLHLVEIGTDPDQQALDAYLEIR
jgi:hypothetical protein